MKNSESKKAVFIVGSARSGTTLLQSMLASHPEVYSFPETHFFRGTIPKFSEIFHFSKKGKQTSSIWHSRFSWFRYLIFYCGYFSFSMYYVFKFQFYKICCKSNKSNKQFTELQRKDYCCTCTNKKPGLIALFPNRSGSLLWFYYHYY